jgi:hypothetical protein
MSVYSRYVVVAVVGFVAVAVFAVVVVHGQEKI